MEGTIQDYARVGLVTCASFPALMTGGVTMAQVIGEIGADPFFDVVEVTWIEDPRARADAIQAADASSLSVAYSMQPYLLARKLNLSALDESQRRQAVSVARAAIDQALAWDATVFSVLSGPDPGPQDRSRAGDQLLRSLNELCQHTSAHPHMTVCLETFDRKPFGKNQLIGPTSEAVELARRVRSSRQNFGLLLDLSHLPLLDESPQEALPAAKEFLTTVHVGNCLLSDPNHPAYGDQHPPFGTPGSAIGLSQVTDFLTTLFTIGFLAREMPRLPLLSLEVKPLSDQNPAQVIESGKSILNEAFAQVQIPNPGT